MSVNGPAKYVNAPLPQPSAPAGSCLLTPNGLAIRPVIPMMKGGTRKCKLCKKLKSHKGGFLPSVGQSFASAASKYVAPIAMYGLYKFINRKTPSARKSRKSRKSRKASRN